MSVTEPRAAECRFPATPLMTKHLDARFEQIERLMQVARRNTWRATWLLALITLGGGAAGYKILTVPAQAATEAATEAADARLSHIEAALVELAQEVAVSRSTQASSEAVLHRIKRADK
jgi:hypothetical protein